MTLITPSKRIFSPVCEQRLHGADRKEERALGILKDNQSTTKWKKRSTHQKKPLTK